MKTDVPCSCFNRSLFKLNFSVGQNLFFWYEMPRFQPPFICPSSSDDRRGQVKGLTNDAHKQQFLCEVFVRIREDN